MVDRVTEKDRSNFCDWFQPLLRSSALGPEDIRAAVDDTESLRRAADDLFK
jgi:hypothetical protein